MRFLRTNRLRERLAFAYSTALVVGLCILAGIAFVIFRHLEAQELDHELLTTANAIATLVEVHDAHLAIEANDRRQFFSLLGVRMNALVTTTQHRTLVSNTTRVPAGISLDDSSTEPRLRMFGEGDERIRVANIPIHGATGVLGEAIVWRSFDWISRLEQCILLASGSAIILVVIPAYFFGLLIARRALSPVEHITRTAAAIEERNLSQRLETSDGVVFELRELSVTINRMLDRLESAFERQKRFIGDASHELRTPLSIILAEAELALRHERNDESYRNTLQAISSVGQDMQQLVKIMLKAARAEQDYTADCKDIDIVRVVHDVMELVRVLADQRGIALNYSGLGFFSCKVSAASLTQALIAIMHNAIHYASRNGRILISVTLEQNGLYITAIDDGPGFTSLALQHACERFWQDDTSRSGEGAGLGLFLATSVLAPGKMKLELSNSPNGGASVAILFPIIEVP